jgi:hypothetical protein
MSGDLVISFRLKIRSSHLACPAFTPIIPLSPASYLRILEESKPYPRAAACAWTW